MNEIFERVRGAICDLQGFTKEEVSIESPLGREGLGMDSLDKVELLAALEVEFIEELKAAGIEIIPDEAAEKMLTVQDICSYIKGKQVG